MDMVRCLSYMTLVAPEVLPCSPAGGEGRSSRLLFMM